MPRPCYANVRQPVVTAEDSAFMADLLGEVDVNIATTRTMPRMKAVKNESRRKTRVLSPPLSSKKSKPIKQEVKDISMDDLETENLPVPDDDDYTPMNGDDDVPMSDPMPSSPVAKAIQRKAQPIIKEEEDDDDMEVVQAVGNSNIQTKSINIAGSRPVAKKILKDSYPTPHSSSPVQVSADGVDASDWTSVTNKLNLLSSPAASQTTSFGKLNHESALEDDGSIRMFWFDQIEINGSLCLFGKVKDKTTGKYVSCFTKVDNIMRKLYFLPRDTRNKRGFDTKEDVSFEDIYNEVDDLMTKFGVKEHRIKQSTRKYAFELHNIPKEADYLKLLYPYNRPAVPTDLTGETFSHVFGANTSLFEQFVLWKNIMGPCWLKIEGANFNAVTNASWCKLELQVDHPKNINAISAGVTSVRETLSYTLALATRISCLFAFESKVVRKAMLIIVKGGVSRPSESEIALMFLG